MTSGDIVERLRAQYALSYNDGDLTDADIHEAADEIVTLRIEKREARAEIERLGNVNREQWRENRELRSTIASLQDERDQLQRLLTTIADLVCETSDENVVVAIRRLKAEAANEYNAGYRDGYNEGFDRGSGVA